MIGLLTGCGAAGATDTASTGDYDASLVAGSEIHDLGTETIELTDNDVSTEEEAQEKYIRYLEAVLARDIASVPSVKDANVALTVQDQDSITDALASAEINILLDLEEALTEEGIVNIAEIAARSVGSSTDNVTILDSDGKILY